MLSAEANFRWCLREGCPSGQLYEQTEYLDPHIVCEECAFEMCFTHQRPWHTDLTCAQFDSQREHGDPDFHDTQEWLREHTKPCPGCRVDVEKDAGCFHMTCRACTHEFCWTCLADWNEINPRSGEYRRDAHNEGCFFRTSNVQPTAIQGNDLQAALGGRR